MSYWSNSNNGNKDEVSLFEIPWHDVLFQYVLRCLSWKDMFSLRCSCTSGKALVQEYLKVKNQMDFGPVSDRLNANIFRLITKEARGVRHLKLRTCKFVTYELVRPMFQRNPQLLSLDLEGCSAMNNGALQVLAVHCKRLTVLSLKHCHWVSPAAIVSLSLNCPNLMKLDLTSCWELTDEAICVLLSNCLSLQELSLSRIYGITDQTLGTLATYSKQLHTLDISGCWRITDYGVRLVGEYCRALHHLCISDCRDVTESSLNALRSTVKIDRTVNNSTHFQPYYKIRLQI